MSGFLKIDVLVFEETDMSGFQEIHMSGFQERTPLPTLQFPACPPGTLGRITIHPGRTMKVIATVTGPLKKYVGEFSKKILRLKVFSSMAYLGKEVLVSQITGVRHYPVEPQVTQFVSFKFRLTSISSKFNRLFTPGTPVYF